MTTQEQKRIRRKNRLSHPVRMIKKAAKKYGIIGERPVVRHKRNTGRMKVGNKKVSMRRYAK